MEKIKIVSIIMTLLAILLIVRLIGVYAGVTYVTISAGIFTTIAFFITTMILRKRKLGIGPWVLMSFATLFIILSEIFRVFLKDPRFHQLFLTTSVLVLGTIAIIKYWDTMQLTE